MRILIITAFVLTSLMLACPSFAADPETAARQAEIDADLARSKMRDIRESEAASAIVDGVDAPELRVDEAAAAVQADRLEQAEQEDADAEAAEEQN